tara:strand:+ start:1316 stop:2491 length:1176 start_codon:yes stop_codon:yes gene_type:complete
MNYRIGILNSAIVDYSGGGVYYLNSLIAGLNRYTNHEIVVYYSDLKYEKYIFEDDKVEWIHFNKNNLFRKIINATSLLFEKKIVNYKWDIKNHGIKPDVIITQESLFPYYMGVKFIGFIGDVMYKYFINLEEYSFKKKYIRDISTKIIIKKSSGIVVDSNYSSDDLKKFFKGNKPKIKVVPLCAPPHIDNVLKSNNERRRMPFQKKYNLPFKYFFYPSQYWEHKNHINLLNAVYQAKLSKNITINLVFSGSEDWPLFQEIRKTIELLSLQNQVITLGYVSDEDIISIYKKSRGVIYPSYGDYTGIPIVEAMYFGKPIAAANTFAIPEQVGNAGILFDPHNINDIMEKMITIWNDDGLCKKLSLNSINRSQNFSLKNFTLLWDEMISEAINE